MALPQWPTELPSASVSGSWELAPYRAALATEMESGDIRIRRRAGMSLATLKWSHPIKRSTMDAIFIPFVNDTLHEGTMRFRMPVLLGGGSCEMRTVQIVPESLSYKLQGPKVLVSMSLYVFPASVVS